MASSLGVAGYFSVEEAADFLNVSSPYVIALFNTGEVGSFDASGPRFAVADLETFKRRDDAPRRRLLDELTAEAEAHHLGY